MSGELAPTRERLLVEGMRLFAERGFSDTRVGDIETAAGLQPRRGALYKHFPSKRALLDAAVARHLDATKTAARQVMAFDMSLYADAEPDRLRPLIVAVGRWYLGEMDNQRALTRVLEHDSDQLKPIARVVRTQIIDLAYAAVARLVGAADSSRKVDADALGVVVLGALTAARRTAWTFGSTPLGVSDDRLLDAWADTCLALRGSMQADAG